MKETLITPAGLARLTDELDRLKTTGRHEVTERLRQAFATEADPTANADYQAAREEQALLEARIARLEQRLGAARSRSRTPATTWSTWASASACATSTPAPGVEYELVGSLEADPDAGRISAESPLGRALLGRRKGEVALVEAPKGQLQLQDSRHRASGGCRLKMGSSTDGPRRLPRARSGCAVAARRVGTSWGRSETHVARRTSHIRSACWGAAAPAGTDRVARRPVRHAVRIG